MGNLDKKVYKVRMVKQGLKGLRVSLGKEEHKEKVVSLDQEGLKGKGARLACKG